MGPGEESDVWTEQELLRGSQQLQEHHGILPTCRSGFFQCFNLWNSKGLYVVKSVKYKNIQKFCMNFNRTVYIWKIKESFRYRKIKNNGCHWMTIYGVFLHRVRNLKFSFQFMKVLLIEIYFGMVLCSTIFHIDFFHAYIFVTKCAFNGSWHFVEYFCVDRCEWVCSGGCTVDEQDRWTLEGSHRRHLEVTSLHT